RRRRPNSRSSRRPFRHLHAGKDQTGRRLGQFLARLYFLHLHASGAYADDLAIIDFCEDVSLADRVDLMFAVCLIFSPSRAFPLRCFFSLASVTPEAPMVLADAIIPSAVRRLIIGLLSFFLWDFRALDCHREARIAARASL